MPERGSWAATWVPINSKFPCSLSKDAFPEVLKDGETPDAYSLGIDKPGVLYYQTTPSVGTAWNGIAVVATPTNTPLTGIQVWRFAHNRLWGYQTTTNRLTYGAYGYLTSYVLSDLGYVPVDFESSNITQIVPFGNQIAMFKTDSLYVIRNADNPGAVMVSEYLAQASGLPVADNVIAVDNVLYWCNTHGVFSYDGQNIVELTESIRNNLGTFSSTLITSLTADFQQRRIIGLNGATTKFIIVLGQTPELYDYSGTGFRFTTRTLVGKEGEPFLIDKVSFVYQYSAGDYATCDLDVKINDDWKTESQFRITPANDNGRAEFALTHALSCRKFALRITAMSESLYISNILIHVKSGGVQGYSNS